MGRRGATRSTSPFVAFAATHATSPVQALAATRYRSPVWVFAAALAVVLVACDGGGAPKLHAASAAAPTAASHEAGRAIYNFRCYFCHGYSGDAKTLATSFLQPPPVDFTRLNEQQIDLARIATAVREGKPGTAMKSFRGILTETEMNTVAAFVLEEFVRRKAPNTRYHTAENGWADHERYRDAYAYAKGEIGLDRATESLSAEALRGRQLYLSSCVSCHDRGRASADNTAWEARPSLPRKN